LDMYYSDRGVFSGDEKACKRKALFDQVAPADEMKIQTNAFTNILDQELSSATLDENAMLQFSSEASDSLINYIPQSLNDLSCEVMARLSVDGDILPLTAATDILIFVDTIFQFDQIQAVVYDILEKLDFGFGNTYTIFDAQEAKVIVENTTDTSHLFGNWTLEDHQRHQTGLNLPNIIKELRFRAADQLDLEKNTPSLVGKSYIALVITQLSSPDNGESNHVVEQLEFLRSDAPDLRLVFMASGATARFERFVRDKRRDLFTLTLLGGSNGESVEQHTLPVAHRLEEEPRRIANHRCGSKWNNGELGNNNIAQFVSPGGINFYRVAPNYFFRKQDNRKLKIQGAGYGSLTVCHSREIEHPRENATVQNGQKWCRNIHSDTIDIDLYQPCSGYGRIIDCPPFYFSVEFKQTGPSTSFRCMEIGCRNPDDAKFIIHAENLGCFSSSVKVLGSIVLLVVSFLTSLRLI